MGCCSSNTSGNNSNKKALLKKENENDIGDDNTEIDKSIRKNKFHNKNNSFSKEKFRYCSYPKAKSDALDELLSSNPNFILLKVQANCREQMYPIWVEKNTSIKFKVSGKWRIDPQYDYTNSIGIPTSLVQGFNNGALVGRIGSSDYFLIKDPTVKKATVSGPLYLKMNLPKIRVRPSGILYVKVYDAQKMNYEEINKKLGWNEVAEDNTNFSLEKMECKLVDNINNMIINPMLFFEKNVGNYTEMILTQDYMKSLDKVENKKPLKIGNYIASEIDNFFRVIKQKKLNTLYSKNSLTAFCEKINKKLILYLGGSMTQEFKLLYKTTRDMDIMKMSLEFLYDYKERDFLFKSFYKQIAAKIIKNAFNEINLVIIVLFNEENIKKQ